MEKVNFSLYRCQVILFSPLLCAVVFLGGTLKHALLLFLCRAYNGKDKTKGAKGKNIAEWGKTFHSHTNDSVPEGK